ncbi:MAG: alkaline phosphatase family protein [Ignavibacteria bacterium]
MEVGAEDDVRAGEKLCTMSILQFAKSASVDGSNAMNTMLLVTFDEHGGTHDHVPPPSVVPPPVMDPEMGFTFDRLGVRVPAIAVGVDKERHYYNDEMHHAAAISSLCRKYN